ncbi:nucleoside hydrolase [Microbacterium sp. dk485]|uniref:nucleoside hydrolase n=1 Tax=Microbacterium sp. dk485 TaxID=2560021 RepID=UPI001073F4D6|nr:nucleoside hydrolase [Microbacterium sp. dk485]TFV84764.1 nucleoside hydrolase [Microbacterium sp. dk485]
MTTPIPVYLDCDPGVDDTLALAYLLASPNVELVGIGTVSGNTSAAQAARNTLDLLCLAGAPAIPVAVGAHDHLDHPYAGGAGSVHGDNGVGGVELPRAPGEPDARSAVQLLIDLSHEYEGRLHVLAIGPLTNIAHALAADPTLPARVAEVTAMGGAALAPGNITPAAEANVFNDPRAAAEALAGDWDVTLVPLDATMEHTLSEEQRGMLLADERPFVRTVGEILDHYFDFYVGTYGRRTCALHDPLAAVLAAGAVTPTRAPRVPIVVDVSDGPGRGQTIADLRTQRIGVRDHDGVRTRLVLDVESSIGQHLIDTILAG